MTWRCQELLDQLAYEDVESRMAFRTGYADGYGPMQKREDFDPRQPYSRGYWEGRHDRIMAEVVKRTGSPTGRLVGKGQVFVSTISEEEGEWFPLAFGLDLSEIEMRSVALSGVDPWGDPDFPDLCVPREPTFHHKSGIVRFDPNLAGQEIRIDYVREVEPLPERPREAWQPGRNRKIRRR